MNTKVIGFDKVKDTYPNCLDFGSFTSRLVKVIFASLLMLSFMMVIFLKELSCAFPILHLERLIWEVHAGRLAGHFGKDKTITLVEDKFY